MTLRARQGTHVLLALRARFPVSPVLCGSLPEAEVFIEGGGAFAVACNGVDDQGIEELTWWSEGVFLLRFEISAFSSARKFVYYRLAEEAKQVTLRLTLAHHAHLDSPKTVGKAALLNFPNGNRFSSCQDWCVIMRCSILAALYRLSSRLRSRVRKALLKQLVFPIKKQNNIITPMPLGHIITAPHRPLRTTRKQV